MKVSNYGFKTPVRRITNNVTGNKVGGSQSGSECKIIRSRKVMIDGAKEYIYKVSLENAIPLFNRDISIAAIGGYFLCDSLVNINFEIRDSSGNIVASKACTIEQSSGNFVKVGLDYEFEIDKEDPRSSYEFRLLISTDSPTDINYSLLSFGFVDTPYFVDQEEFYQHYNNSKRNICIPEQFYFDKEIELENSVEGEVIILKSCNRCQRFLPINHFNERIHISFSNHCGPGKAPCKHSGFSKYEILSSDLDASELQTFVNNTSLSISGNYLTSYFGHQLECRSCKKFFVNVALNHLRTTTQHKEDALRRRAFEKLLGDLTGETWIYHRFRLESNKEFDVHIWEKFGKKCFNCNKSLSSQRQMHLDHTMPLASLYPLDESATCLCAECNNKKRDSFPVDFYSPEKLAALSRITGIDAKILNSKLANQKMIELLKEKIVWFFDDFITFEEYVKEREGKRAADSIIRSLQRAVNNSSVPFNIEEEYERQKFSS